MFIMIYKTGLQPVSRPVELVSLFWGEESGCQGCADRQTDLTAPLVPLETRLKIILLDVIFKIS